MPLSFYARKFQHFVISRNGKPGCSSAVGEDVSQLRAELSDLQGQSRWEARDTRQSVADISVSCDQAMQAMDQCLTTAEHGAASGSSVEARLCLVEEAISSNVANWQAVTDQITTDVRTTGKEMEDVCLHLKSTNQLLVSFHLGATPQAPAAVLTSGQVNGPGWTTSSPDVPLLETWLTASSSHTAMTPGIHRKSQDFDGLSRLGRLRDTAWAGRQRPIPGTSLFRPHSWHPLWEVKLWRSWRICAQSECRSYQTLVSALAASISSEHQEELFGSFLRSTSQQGGKFEPVGPKTGESWQKGICLSRCQSPADTAPRSICGCSWQRGPKGPCKTGQAIRPAKGPDQYLGVRDICSLQRQLVSLIRCLKWFLSQSGFCRSGFLSRFSNLVDLLTDMKGLLQQMSSGNDISRWKEKIFTRKTGSGAQNQPSSAASASTAVCWAATSLDACKRTVQ